VDEAIEATRKVVEQTRQIKASLLQELFTHGLPDVHTKFKENKFLGHMPRDWKTRRIGDVFEVELGKMLSGKSKTGTAYRPYLGNWNVQWGTFDLSRVEQMDFDGEEIERFSLRNGDILICEGGEVGRTAIWQGQIEGCCYQKALHRLRPRKEGEANTGFFLYFMMHAARNNILARYTNASSIAHLTQETFVDIELPLPTYEEQERIAAVLEQVDICVDVEHQRMSGLRMLKTALSQTLLTGQKRVKV